MTTSVMIYLSLSWIQGPWARVKMKQIVTQMSEATILVMTQTPS